MEVANVDSGVEVFGQNNAKLGRMDGQGVVRCNGVVILRVVGSSIYSMHGGYLGRLTDGVGKTERGQLIFSTRKP
jgi:hypothetical protein